jgi:hypothetical protein
MKLIENAYYVVEHAGAWCENGEKLLAEILAAAEKERESLKRGTP